MAEIVNTLFGIDPAVLQQQQANTDFNRAFQFAQLDPFQRANMALFQSGAQIARGAGQLLGGDEQLNRATQIRQLASQVDFSNPDSIEAFAQQVSTISPQVASEAAQRAANLRLTGARTTRALRESKTPTSALGKLINERDELIAGGLTANDPRILAYDKAIAAESSGETRGTKVNLDLGGFATLFAKKEAEAGGKNVADQIQKAQDALSTNSKVSRDIAEVERILPNAFTGQFANFAKTASKTLSALNIPVSEKASNTEVLNALFTNFVLPAVRQLPGSLAAKELDFLRQSKPEALQEPATIKRLVTLLKDDIAANRALVKRADEYRKADKFGSLKDFNIALQQDSIYQDLTKYRQLEARVRSGQKISKEEAEFAKKIEQDLGL